MKGKMREVGRGERRRERTLLTHGDKFSARVSNGEWWRQKSEAEMFGEGGRPQSQANSIDAASDLFPTPASIVHVSVVPRHDFCESCVYPHTYRPRFGVYVPRAARRYRWTRSYPFSRSSVDWLKGAGGR